MSTRENRGTPCPVCGAASVYEEPPMVDIGVGEVPCGPEAWDCPVHGHWWYAFASDDLEAKPELRVEFPDGRPADTAETAGVAPGAAALLAGLHAAAAGPAVVIGPCAVGPTSATFLVHDMGEFRAACLRAADGAPFEMPPGSVEPIDHGRAR